MTTPPPRLLGEVMITLGCINAEQLHTALSMQRWVGGRVGRLLIELGACQERDLQFALACQHGLTPIALDEAALDVRLRGALPLSFARHASLVPVRIKGGRLELATPGPVDQVVLREACALAGVRGLAVRVCTEAAFERALGRMYGASFALAA